MVSYIDAKLRSRYRHILTPFVGARSPVPSSPPFSFVHGTAGPPKFVASTQRKNSEKEALSPDRGGW